jgi:hypothetical protein
MAKLVVLLLTPRTYLPMEIFSFSKGFRLYKLLEIVRHYKYLGIMLSLNGKFTQALLDLTRRGQKAFFKLRKMAEWSSTPSISVYASAYSSW